MKINVLKEKFSSNLSCTIKCLGFLRIMNHKKIICGLFFLTSLGACGAPTAMIGPAYTLTTSGNVMQAGFAYSSSELVTMYTGKTPLENIKEISLNDQNNIQKQTLESEDFYNLVKIRIEKTNAILKSSNQ